jgi:Ni2+-binding GTPase involved in maturation of urease and hydrogenase
MEGIRQEILRVIDEFGAENVQRTIDLIRSPGEKIDIFMNEDRMLIDDNRREIKNVVVTSPTQNGKTQYLIDAIKRRPSGGEIFVISCDNSKVQRQQMMERLNSNGIVKVNTSCCKSNVEG